MRNNILGGKQIMIYNIGIIGTGIMGKNHVRVLKNMSDKFNIIGIFDENVENAKNTAVTYNVKYFENIDELLSQVDSVVVATPSSTHKEIGLKCISIGINLLIEKPLALTVEDGDEINEATSGWSYRTIQPCNIGVR
jgi:predicted dehydrogenase